MKIRHYHGANGDLRVQVEWDEAMDSLLRTMVAQGVAYSQIARAVSAMARVTVSRSAAIGRGRRLGLHRAGTESERVNKREASLRNGCGVVTAARKRGTLAPKAAPTGAREPHALRDPKVNVRFIDRRKDQCPMFCEGEEGPLGFVCGAPVVFGSWCALCGSRVFDLNAIRRNKSGKAA